MKFKDVMKALFTAIGDFIKVITQWLSIALDWTDEVKAMSDTALVEMRQEREVDTLISKTALEKALNERLEAAGLDLLKDTK